MGFSPESFVKTGIFLFILVVLVMSYNKIQNCIEDNGGSWLLCLFSTNTSAGLKVLKEGLNVPVKLVNAYATKHNLGGVGDKSGGNKVAAKFTLYKNMEVRDTAGNLVTITIKNDSIAGGVTDLTVINYCNNFTKNRLGQAVIKPENIRNPTFTELEISQLNEYSRYYGEQTYTSKTKDGKPVAFTYTTVQMQKNNFDNKQHRTYRLYTGGQIDIHASEKLYKASVIMTVPALAVIPGGYVYQALVLTATIITAVLVAKEGTRVTQKDVLPGQTTNPELFRLKGKNKDEYIYPTTNDSDIKNRKTVSKQILTSQDIRAGVNGVLKYGHGFVINRKKYDNMYYPTDLLLLYGVRQITYKRLVGGKGLFNLVQNTSNPEILLYKPVVDSNGNIEFNARIRYLPETEPGGKVIRYVSEFMNASNVKERKYNAVFNAANDGWIANESVRAALHALCLLKTDPSTGVLTTDPVFQNWMGCYLLNDKLFSREMVNSGYAIPKTKRFRINACHKKMPSSFDNGNLHDLVGTTPINFLCGNNNFISDASKKFCNSLNYDGKGPEGDSMFYYPGANNGGRQRSNCLAGAGSYRYSLAMDKLPKICNTDYGFPLKLVYFNMYNNNSNNFLTAGSINGTVYLNGTSGNKKTKMGYLNIEILLSTGTFTALQSLEDLADAASDGKGSVLVKIQLNDKYLTANIKKTSDPLFMSVDNIPNVSATKGLYNDIQDTKPDTADLGIDDLNTDPKSKKNKDYNAQLWLLYNCKSDDHSFSFNLVDAETGKKVYCDQTSGKLFEQAGKGGTFTFKQA